jgi:hypothetical protein
VNALSAQPSDSLASATGTEAPVDNAIELHPVYLESKNFLNNSDEDAYDFTPRPIEDDATETEGPDDASDPKDSSAASSALAAIFETVRTPDFGLVTENPASVEKVDSPPSPSESGSSTSSEATSVGKTKPPA